MTYGDVHRFFLRTVASQGVLTLLEIKKIMDTYTGGNKEIKIPDLVKEVNDEIRQYQQEIKLTSDEVSNNEVVVFMSVGYDDATKSQNVFSPTELEFFRTLIEQIMTTESRQVTGINAINLVGKMKSSFTKTDAQKLLNMWCKMRYLDKEENNYALGVRAIHEFEGYLRQNMPDIILECCLCKQIVYRGYNCPGCFLAVHTKCLKRYLKKVQKWPCCKIDFNSDQLERLNNDSSRSTQSQHLQSSQQLQPTQQLPSTQQSVVYNTIAEPTLNQDSSDDLEVTQNTSTELSQRASRKRKLE